MEQEILTIRENREIARDIYLLCLEGNTAAITAPGQFVNLKLQGFFLRRPISVCDWREGELKLIYKVLGKGTAYLTTMAPGEKLDILLGLGNGYDCSKSGQRPLLLQS